MTSWLAIFVLFLAVERPADTEWLTGAAWEKAARQNAVGANWTQAPLGPQLAAFARAQRIAIALDRRVDPTQRVDLQVSGVTLEQFLWKLAEPRGLGVVQVGDLFYLGPRDRVALLAARLQRMETELTSAAGSEAWLKPVRWQSNQPFEPRLQLQGLCQSAGLELANPQDIPMDLWGPVDWPELPAYRAVGLVLTGFDLWPEKSLPNFRVAPPADAGTLQVRLKLPPDAKPNGLVRELRKQWNQAELNLDAGQLAITADPETLSRVMQSLAELYRPTATVDATRRFTLKTNAARGSILATIAQQTGLKLEYDPEARPVLEIRTQIDVQEATLEELIQATLNGSGLEFKLESGVLKLSFPPDR